MSKAEERYKTWSAKHFQRNIGHATHDAFKEGYAVAIKDAMEVARTINAKSASILRVAAAIEKLNERGEG